MKVSVVIPTLNEEKMIGRCLASIRGQTVPVEIVVVDGGSSDRTVEVAREIADKVIVIPGSSIAEARQRGAEEASGDIIVSTDADVIAPINWVASLVKHLEDPNVSVVGGSIRPLNENEYTRLYADGLNVISRRLGLFIGSNMAYRKEDLLKVGGYSSLVKGEDWNLSLRLRRIGRAVYDPEAYVLTEIPLNRQVEFASIAASLGLLASGLALKSSYASGLGAGFIASEFYTSCFEEPSNLHHSQIAVAGLALLSLFRGAVNRRVMDFLTGLLGGLLWHHIVTEDIYSPIWLHVNGSLLLGVSLLFLST